MKNVESVELNNKASYGMKNHLHNRDETSSVNSTVDDSSAKPDGAKLGDATSNQGTTRRNDCPNFVQALNTMGNGLIPQVIDAPNIFLTIFWILAYLGLSAVFAFQMYTLTNQYMSFNVDTSLKIVRKSEAQFPSVTVCNTNPVRKSIISKVAKYEDLGSLDEYAQSTMYSTASADFGVNYTVSCSQGYVQCAVTKECIPYSWMCDDIPDCSDSWDEDPANCAAVQSSSSISNAYEDHNPEGYCVLGFIKCSETEPICASPCNNVTECSDGKDESASIGCTVYTSCGGTLTATSSPQTFASPNYPTSNYNTNDDCYWIITAQSGEVVQVEFDTNKFNIEEADGGCPYDYVRFHNGMSADNFVSIEINGKRKICGATAPTNPIKSTSQSMTAHFFSDGSVQLEGFQVTYTSVSQSSARRARREVPDSEEGADQVEPETESSATTSDGGIKTDEKTARDKKRQLRRRRRSINGSDTVSSSGSGSSYNFYNDYGEISYDHLWENYDAFYDAFNPFKSVPDDLEEFDWLTLYDESTSPDYSDLRAFALFTEDEINWFGTQAVDFIAQCTYDGRDCDVSSFIRFANPKFGNCFMFNSVYNQSSEEDGSFLRLRSTSKTGQEYGLKLTLFLDTENYIGVLSQKAGAQILINPAIDPALPESDSTLISAGTSTSLSIRQEVIKRKGSPYGDCFTDWPKDKLKFADEFLSLWPVYNQKACEQYCIQRYMFETCSCAQSYFPTFRDANDSSLLGNTLCSMWDSTQRECTVQVYKDYRNGIINCPCNAACTDEYYSFSQSSADWPNENYTPYLITNIRKSTQSNAIRNYLNELLANSELSMSEKTTHIRRNFLRVEVHYQNLNFEEVSEKPSYLITNLITDFGGNIGLWIGWSVLSLLEIFVLFFNVAKILFTGRL